MSLTFVDVYIDERSPDTLPAIGTVTFSLSNALMDSSGHTVYDELPVVVRLVGGQGIAHLVANDNTGVVPQNTSYLVKLDFLGMEPTYRQVVVPKASPVAYLSDLSTPTTTVPLYQYALESDFLTLQSLVSSLILTGTGPGFFNVANYGTGNNSAAYISARSAATAADGGVVFFPPGTFTADNPQGSQHGTMPPASNIVVLGCGAATVIKIPNGANSGAGHWSNVFCSKEATDVVNNFHLRDLLIDYNGPNNLIPDPGVDATTKYNYGLGVFNGDNITADGIVHLNNPGANSVLLGTNASPRTVKRGRVRNQYFHNFGTGVSGNTHSTDHSAIYAACEDFVGDGLQFANDTTRSKGTAVELHCDRAVVTGATGSNVERAFNFGAQFADSDAVEVKGAAFTKIQFAGNAYVDSGRAMRRLEVDGVFVQDDGTHSLFNVFSNVLGKIEEVVLKGHAGYSGAPAAASEPAVIASPLVRYLKVALVCSDLLGGPVGVFDAPGGADTPDGDMVVDVDDLVVLDCGRTTDTSARIGVRLHATTGNKIAAFSMKGTRFVNTSAGGGHLGPVVNSFVPIPLIEILDPFVQGVAFPQWTMQQTALSTDSILVRAALACGASNPSGQNMACSLGSEIRNTSSATGQVWRKTSLNNANGGWVSIDYGSAAPSGGSYNVGDIRWNNAPAASGNIGWVYTSGGWKTFGAIAA